MIGKQASKFVIGVGTNMPVTLLIGLPFQIAAQCMVDLANLKCHSAMFDTTWKLTLKMPHKKSLWSLDAATSSSTKRVAFQMTPSIISPSPKRAKRANDISDDEAALVSLLSGSQE